MQTCKQQRRAWLRARDLLMGRNECKANAVRALELASRCEHPEALWLCRVLQGWKEEKKELKKRLEGAALREEAATTTQEERQDRLRAMALLALIFKGDDAMSLLCEAARGGDGLAMATMARLTGPLEKRRWATLAAEAGEAEGQYVLGICWHKGFGSEQDSEQAMLCYRQAAEQGWVEAQLQLGLMYSLTEPERFVWVGRAARKAGKRFAEQFLTDMLRVAERGPCSPEVQRRIAEALKDRIGEGTIFKVAAGKREMACARRIVEEEPMLKENEEAHSTKKDEKRKGESDLKKRLEEAERRAALLEKEKEAAEQLLAQSRSQLTVLEDELQREKQESALVKEAGRLVLERMSACQEESGGFDIASCLENVMSYTHLSREGVWQTRHLKLPRARLDDVEAFEVPPSHPAYGGERGQARGVRVKAGCRIAANETVFYYAGIVRPGCPTQRDDSDYPFSLTDSGDVRQPVVDALLQGNESRFINAARGSQFETNCSTEFQVLTLGGKTKVTCVCVFTLCDVEGGQELFIDYGDHYWRAKENRDKPQLLLSEAVTAWRHILSTE